MYQYILPTWLTARFSHIFEYKEAQRVGEQLVLQIYESQGDPSSILDQEVDLIACMVKFFHI